MYQKKVVPLHRKGQNDPKQARHSLTLNRRKRKALREYILIKSIC